MPAIPFLDQASSGPAPVSRPAATISFAAASPASSGFGGLVDAAASLLAGAPGDPWREHLLALRLRRCLAPEADLLQLLVAAVPTAPAVALADKGSVSLIGTGGSDTQIFTGKIDGIRERASGGRLVTASNGSRELAQGRL